MSYYNFGTKYNFNVPDGGGLYNSAPYSILILDYGSGIDSISALSAYINLTESGQGQESAAINAALSSILESGTGFDSVTPAPVIVISDSGSGDENINPIIMNLTVADSGSSQESAVVNNMLSAILDSGEGIESAVVNAIASTTDSGQGIDNVIIQATLDLVESGSVDEYINLRKFSADTYFVITSENILQPLGVIVLKDSAYEFMPKIKDITEKIPGKHGGITFSSKYKARLIELKVATAEGLSFAEREELKRNIAKYLNPKKTKGLVYLDDVDVEYNVKYAGKINLHQHADWFEFTIPLKQSDPFIYSARKRKVGSGTLTNNGTKEAYIIIEIIGEVVNPSITIGDDTLSYTGTIQSGEKLVIDTKTMTVKLDEQNVLHNYSGCFPKLQTGDTSVLASDNVTFWWQDRWV